MEGALFVAGVFLAKALQDGRLVDLPLSTPFLKLLCQGDVACPVATGDRRKAGRAGSQPPASDEDVMTSSVFSQDGDLGSAMLAAPRAAAAAASSSSSSSSGWSASSSSAAAAAASSSPSPSWYAGILSHEDLAVVDPTRGRFLLQLRALANRRRQILTDPTLTPEDRCRQADNLALTPYTATANNKPSIVSQKIHSAAGQVRLEDLGLTFQFAPSSKVFGFTDTELRPGGADYEVTLENMEDYLELMSEFCLERGIRRQMEALRQGFDRVFPMSRLAAFSPAELRLLLCGDQSPSWTRDDILNYTEPKLGYSRDSPGFQVRVSFFSLP